MPVAVHADGVSGRSDLPDEIRVASDVLAHEEERGEGTLASQRVEHGRRPLRMGPVVEGERDRRESSSRSRTPKARRSSADREVNAGAGVRDAGGCDDGARHPSQRMRLAHRQSSPRPTGADSRRRRRRRRPPPPLPCPGRTPRGLGRPPAPVRHGVGHDMTHVPPLLRERSGGAAVRRQLCLRDAFVVAARDEVAKRGARRRDVVRDPCAGLEHHQRRGARAQEADADVGLLAADGARSDAPDARPEAADGMQRLDANRHVPAERVAHGRPLRGDAAVAVADDPAELIGEPHGALGGPDRVDGATDDRDPAVGERSDEPRQPVVARDRVVVEERHDVARGAARTRVARSGQPSRSWFAMTRQSGSAPRRKASSARCGRRR